MACHVRPSSPPHTHRRCAAAQLARTHPDNIWLRDTIDACKWLGLGFFFTGERKFAEQLRRRVYTFFLDEATGMAPSLKYAQSIPGIAEGRPQVR